MKKASFTAILLSLIMCVSGCGAKNGANPETAPGGAKNSETRQIEKGDDEPVNTEDGLFERFNSGDVSLRPRPLFFWNKALTGMKEQELRQLIKSSFEECGYGGFGILPYWLDGYLTDRYFDLYEAALDEGSKYGMQFSLYDENGFPSYTAGGLLAEKYPELTAKRLDMISKREAPGRASGLSFPTADLWALSL